MGSDLEQYVHPERISAQLICPICTQVLKSPVQTSTDHLFCEDELLEWMTRSNLCPVTKQELDPERITKPSRIILNMLAELEVFCSNRNEGCKWTGPHEQLKHHIQACSFRPRQELYSEIQQLQERNTALEAMVEQSCARADLLAEENAALKGIVEHYQERLRVFHALLPTNSRPELAFEGDDPSFYDESSLLQEDEEEDADYRGTSRGSTTDAERLRALRSLQSLQEDEGSQATKERRYKYDDENVGDQRWRRK